MTQRLDYQKLSAASVRAVGGVYVYVTNAGLPKTLLSDLTIAIGLINLFNRLAISLRRPPGR